MVEHNKLDGLLTELLENFTEDCRYEMKRLAASGAVAEEDIDAGFAKCVLLLTAQGYAPKGDRYQEMLENLKHF